MLKIFKKHIKEESNSSQFGFTVVELLVATAVFSVVLVVFLSAMIRVSQLFYKGVSMSNTQETARTILQDISDDLQFYGQQPTIGANYFCIGNHRYSYNLYTQVGSGNYGLVRENISLCKPTSGALGQPPDSSKYSELLDPGMQLNKLNLVDNNGVININLKVVFYGSDNSVLVSYTGSPAWRQPDAICSGPPSSSQFCSVAEYNGTVLQSF